MPLLSYSATPSKGGTVTVTLDKTELLALNAVGIDSFWSGGSDGDVAQAIVTLKTFPGNGKINLTFDLSQATPTAPLALPQYARDVFQIAKIVLVDTMGDKINLSRAELLLEIPTLSESEVNLSGNLLPPTISSLDVVFESNVPRFRFDIFGLYDDVAGNLNLTIYQLTGLPNDLAEVESLGTVVASQSGVSVDIAPGINTSINGPTLTSVPEVATMYYFAVIAEDSGANKEYVAIEWEFIPPAALLFAVSDYNGSGSLVGTKFYANDIYKGVVTGANGPSNGIKYLSPNVIKSIHANNQLKTITTSGAISVTSETVPGMSILRSIDVSSGGAYSILIGGKNAASSEGAIAFYDPGASSWTTTSWAGSEIMSVSFAQGTGQMFGALRIIDEFTNNIELVMYNPALQSADVLTTVFIGSVYDPNSGTGTTDVKLKVVAAEDGSRVLCFGREQYLNGSGTDINSFITVIDGLNWTSQSVNLNAGLPAGYVLSNYPDPLYDLPFRDAVINGTTAYIAGLVQDEFTSLPKPAMFTINLAAPVLTMTTTLLGLPTPELGSEVFGAALSIAYLDGVIYISGTIGDTTGGVKTPALWVNGVYQSKGSLPQLTTPGESIGVFVGFSA
jgi:hypothetical protein